MPKCSPDKVRVEPIIPELGNTAYKDGVEMEIAAEFEATWPPPGAWRSTQIDAAPSLAAPGAETLINESPHATMGQTVPFIITNADEES